MKRLFFAALCAIPVVGMGQTLLYNDGAMIKVQPGATLYVEGGIHNTSTGTIDNDGTIEVKGDFLNQGTWEASDPNILKFSGNAHSNVTPGSAQFDQVIIQKESTFNVNLLGHMTVNGLLDFNAPGSSRIVTGNFDFKLGPDATITGADANEYIATTGTGMVEKSVTANGSFTYPIGDLTNYSPLEAAYTGSGYTAATIRTRVNDEEHPQKPADASDYISRYWEVNADGIADYENTLTGTYIPADLTGTATKVKGAVYDGSEWFYFDAAAGSNIVIGSTQEAMVDFTGTNFFGKVNLVAFLQGPYNTSTDQMTVSLNTMGLIPLDSPYSDASASVGSIPSGVTDWVKLELRDPASPATILGRTSAFIKNNGSIVGLDGSSFPMIKDGLPVSIVGLVHRNHLSIRTPNAGIDVVDPSVPYDFTTGIDKAFTNGSHPNNNMKEVEAGVWALWAGNANITGSGLNNVRYTGLNNDNAAILNALGGNTAVILSNVYHQADLNMNGNVRYTGLQNDNQVLVNVLNGNTANIWTAHQ